MPDGDEHRSAGDSVQTPWGCVVLVLGQMASVFSWPLAFGDLVVKVAAPPSGFCHEGGNGGFLGGGCSGLATAT